MRYISYRQIDGGHRWHISVSAFLDENKDVSSQRHLWGDNDRYQKMEA